MTDIRVDYTYFGFIEGEFVEWSITEEMTLSIGTQLDQHLKVGKGRWARKATLFFWGKIEFSFRLEDRVYSRYIRICPERERDANYDTFFSGRNGPLNGSRRDFSRLLGKPRNIIFDDE